MTDTLSSPRQTKSLDYEDHATRDAMHDFMSAFEVYKDANDTRLRELERRSSADTITIDKLNRLDNALDEQKQALESAYLTSRRPGLATEASSRAIHPEHKSHFESYVRRGAEDQIRKFEEKALSIGSDPDGGYLVPDETETEIMRRLTQISPMRSISGLRQVSSSTYKKPFSSTGASTGWVGETDVRPQTASPSLSELNFPTMELYAMPAATSSLLDDSAVDIDAWIAEEVEAAFAEQEGAAFINGDGSNKPRGFLDHATVDEASWSWGNLGYIATGDAGALPSTDPSDVLIDLVYALKAGYRQNATWLMNRKTQASLRKIKDADGNYIWQPPASAGAPASLMGFALREAEDMPDIADNATAVAFGDFRRGYLIVDRIGVRVLRDPYSAKPYVLFYTTKRVGGGIQDFDAIKLLKFGVA